MNSMKVADKLMKEHGFKLKGTGPISYHLGCDFFRDQDGTLCMTPKTYIHWISNNYEKLFGVKPKQSYSLPMEKADHPELNDTEELGPEDMKKYQSLIGTLQWAVSIGRFNIATAVMTMSKFRSAPKSGHLSRVRRIVGYLTKMKHGVVRFRVGKPDLSSLDDIEYGWERTIYRKVSEIIPPDCPKPLGDPVVMTTYVDANLMHDVTTGRSVTGILHLLNKTPIEWYTKCQPTVETATYRAEFMAARTATEQIMDLRTTLRYLGVNLEGPTYLFRDNRTVVDSCAIPKAKLHKRHVLLSFHRVREAIAARILRFFHIPGSMNPADILSKAWGYSNIQGMLKALLFWEGDTGLLLG